MRDIALDSDALVAELQKLRGKANPLSAAALQALRDEDAHTLVPAWLMNAEALTLEHELSDLVNAAYGLTPAEIELMWDTAPPRMPMGRPPTAPCRSQVTELTKRQGKANPLSAGTRDERECGIDWRVVPGGDWATWHECLAWTPTPNSAVDEALALVIPESGRQNRGRAESLHFTLRVKASLVHPNRSSSGSPVDSGLVKPSLPSLVSSGTPSEWKIVAPRSCGLTGRSLT